MDGLPLGVPGSLPDFLRHEAERLRQQRARAARARRKAPRPTPPAEGGRVPLADGLSFRLLSRSLRPAQADAAVETFRRAFLDVWVRVAAPDRRQLLTYWRDQPDRATGADRYGPRHATVRIRVEDLVEGVDWSPAHSACERLAHELVFPTSLVMVGQDRLPQVIARTLALALRYATGPNSVRSGRSSYESEIDVFTHTACHLPPQGQGSGMTANRPRSVETTRHRRHI